MYCVEDCAGDKQVGVLLEVIAEQVTHEPYEAFKVQPHRGLNMNNISSWSAYILRINEEKGENA